MINITVVALSQWIAVESNVTLTCNIQLDPSVDSTVMVNRTWLGPSGATLSGTAPNKNGSIYQSVLTITSLKTTDVGIYTCSMTVFAVVPQFIAQTTASTTVQGTPQHHHVWYTPNTTMFHSPASPFTILHPFQQCQYRQ